MPKRTDPFRTPPRADQDARATEATPDAEARLSFRVDARLKTLIERAAGYSGETVTSYAIATLLRDARRIVQEHEVSVLSDRDRNRFLALLDQPLVPNAALQRAARRHRDLVVPDGTSDPSDPG